MYPHRTRTCNPLIKRQPGTGSGDVGKGDSGGRVCGSVSGTNTDLKANGSRFDDAHQRRETPSDTAGVAEVIIEVLRRLGKL